MYFLKVLRLKKLVFLILFYFSSKNYVNYETCDIYGFSRGKINREPSQIPLGFEPMPYTKIAKLYGGPQSKFLTLHGIY
jgi:hypothetical protein